MATNKTITRKEKSLPVKPETLSLWRNEVVKHHLYEISDATGLHVNTVRVAIKGGLATATTVSKLNEFFNYKTAA